MATRSTDVARLVFMHVPKTGGTSLDKALQRHFGPTSEGNVDFGTVTAAWRLLDGYGAEGEQSLSWLQVINSVLCYKIAKGAPYLSGHFAVTEELLVQSRPPYRFVTLLRDPMARWKSNYVYSRIRNSQNATAAAVPDIERELHEFLESPRAAEEGAKYVRYLGGFRTPDALADDAVVRSAKRLLSMFDVVGTLDELPRFEDELSALLGERIRVPHLRKVSDYREPEGRTSADYDALFTTDVNDRVRELCAPDYAIYRHAREATNVGVDHDREAADARAAPASGR